MYPDKTLQVDGQNVYGEDMFRIIMERMVRCKWCERRNGIFSDMRDKKKIYSLTLKGKLLTETLNDFYD